MDPFTIMAMASLVPGLLGAAGPLMSSGSDQRGTQDTALGGLTGLFSMFAGAGPGTVSGTPAAGGGIAGAKSGGLAGLLGGGLGGSLIGSLIGLIGGDQGKGALFREGVRQQLAKSPLAGVQGLVRQGGLGAISQLRGTSAGTALANLANQIDKLGGWDVVARSGGDLAKTARKAWQITLTGEAVDPKARIPSTTEVMSLLGGGTRGATGGYDYPWATPMSPSGGNVVPTTMQRSAVWGGLAGGGGSYWSRMGTVYNPGR